MMSNCECVSDWYVHSFSIQYVSLNSPELKSWKMTSLGFLGFHAPPAKTESCVCVCVADKSFFANRGYFVLLY